MARGVRHFVAAAALVAAVAYAALYGGINPPPTIQSDRDSYYVYLLSAFIYHDVTLETLAADCGFAASTCASHASHASSRRSTSG